MSVPTQDQVMGQLRVLIPAVGTIVTAIGIAKSDQVNAVSGYLLQAVGPISYIIAAVWSAIANSRKSIMLAAAKPLNANTPSPQIVLPSQEAALAAKLPSNVTTTQDTKVVRS